MDGPVDRRGYRIFVDELVRFAAEIADARVTAVCRDAAVPLRIGVRGRPGVGRDTAARALRTTGLQVGEPADVDVFVVAEVVKPEDRAAITASPRPKVVVLNKADLSGFGPGGPMTVAAARCARYRTLTGVPTVPMAAHLAVAELDDELVDALRLLAAEPADLCSTDGFVDSPHRLPAGVRRRLLEALDLFGIAHGVLLLRNRPGADVATVRAMLRRCSGIHTVVENLPLGDAGYQRAGTAVRALEVLAAVAESGLAWQIAGFLASDDAVIARMTAAVDVVEAAGLTVDRGDDAHAHLRRAAHWQRYSRGPVSAAHRACGADISRGSLRLLRRVRQ